MAEFVRFPGHKMEERGNEEVSIRVLKSTLYLTLEILPFLDFDILDVDSSPYVEISIVTPLDHFLHSKWFSWLTSALLPPGILFGCFHKVSSAVFPEQPWLLFQVIVEEWKRTLVM